ncbi:MAG TPA: hypothetical protein DEG43_05000 [Acidimicrobiaceae bacterium]|nr:hypothetical protein [Acidimicrobiaceae bacterium]
MTDTPSGGEASQPLSSKAGRKQRKSGAQPRKSGAQQRTSSAQDQAPQFSSDARGVALSALVEIDAHQSYANLRLGPLLERSTLDERDRRLVTELVYGTIRRRDSLDFLVNRFLTSTPPPAALAALRCGAYQLRFLDIPDHAAVSATVDATPKRYRPMVNAVLRKVATAPVQWPTEAVRLSYPQWIVDRLSEDLGEEEAIEALETMNRSPEVTTREDGYTQDLASQWVAAAVGAQAGEVVLDCCAAPGGKATALANTGALVIAADRAPKRVRLISQNRKSLDASTLIALVADAAHPPFRAGFADRVVVDAPCSGLGVLRRRPDARWRVQQGDVDRLAHVQLRLLRAAATLVKPGGVLVYSVCTLTTAETSGVAEAFVAGLEEGSTGEGWEPLEPLGGLWRTVGTGTALGSMLLPQDADTDGMAIFRWRRHEL